MDICRSKEGSEIFFPFLKPITKNNSPNKITKMKNKGISRIKGGRKIYGDKSASHQQNQQLTKLFLSFFLWSNSLPMAVKAFEKGPNSEDTNSTSSLQDNSIMFNFQPWLSQIQPTNTILIVFIFKYILYRIKGSALVYFYKNVLILLFVVTTKNKKATETHFLYKIKIQFLKNKS